MPLAPHQIETSFRTAVFETCRSASSGEFAYWIYKRLKGAETGTITKHTLRIASWGNAGYSHELHSEKRQWTDLEAVSELTMLEKYHSSSCKKLDENDALLKKPGFAYVETTAPVSIIGADIIRKDLNNIKNAALRSKAPLPVKKLKPK